MNIHMNIRISPTSMHDILVELSVKKLLQHVVSDIKHESAYCVASLRVKLQTFYKVCMVYLRLQFPLKLVAFHEPSYVILYYIQ